MKSVSQMVTDAGMRLQRTSFFRYNVRSQKTNEIVFSGPLPAIKYWLRAQARKEKTA